MGRIWPICNIFITIVIICICTLFEQNAMYTNKVSHNGIQFIFIQIFLAKVQLIEVFSVVPLLCMCLCISILNNVNKHCRPFQFLSFCLILGIPQNIFLSRRLSYSYIYTSFSLYHNFHLLICLVVILLVHFLSQIFFPGYVPYHFL